LANGWACCTLTGDAREGHRNHAQTAAHILFSR
jgi:hypothetical protein